MSGKKKCSCLVEGKWGCALQQALHFLQCLDAVVWYDWVAVGEYVAVALYALGGGSKKSPGVS